MVVRFGDEGMIEAIMIASLYTLVGMKLDAERGAALARYNVLPELPQVKPFAPAGYDHSLSQSRPLSIGPVRQPPSASGR